jgi:hypothetical protein
MGRACEARSARIGHAVTAAPVTVTGALGALDDKSIPSSAELIEKIEALPWRVVVSTNILRIAWCKVDSLPTRSTYSPVIAFGWLWVEFHVPPGSVSPDVYVYEDVPERTFECLCEARSIGAAHFRLIRGHYRYAGARVGAGQTFIEASGIA